MSIVANNQSDCPIDESPRAGPRGDRANNDTEAESLVLVQMGTVLYNQGHYAERGSSWSAPCPSTSSRVTAIAKRSPCPTSPG